MKKNGTIIVILIIASFLIISGCKKFEGVDNLKDLTTSPTSAITPIIKPTTTTDSSTNRCTARTFHGSLREIYEK